MGRHSRAEPDGRRVSVARLGELKRGLGWTPVRYVIELEGRPIAAVSIQERPLLGQRAGRFRRYRIHYAPRGPVLLSCAPEAVDAALAGLRSIAVARHSVAFTIDPAWEEGSAPAVALGRAGFRPAAKDVQVSRTAMIVPLEPSEAAQRGLLGHSTGADIKRAVSLGVTTERIDLTDASVRDRALSDFYEMHAVTGKREGFIVRDRDYELEQWRRLGDAGIASLWFAGLGGRDAGALLLQAGRRLVYFAAGSRDGADLHRTRANTSCSGRSFAGPPGPASPSTTWVAWTPNRRQECPRTSRIPSGTCTCSSTASAASRRFAFGLTSTPERAAGQGMAVGQALPMSDDRPPVDTSPPGGGTPENVESPRVHDWRPRNLIPPRLGVPGASRNRI